MTSPSIPNDAICSVESPAARADRQPHGGFFGLIGIILVSLNLNAAVTSLAPIYNLIRKSFPVSIAAQSVMGTLPLLCFAIFGHFTPRLCRRLGLVRTAILAMAMIAVGEVVRAAFSQSILFFGLVSILAVGGIGIGNVIVPPLIRSLFPRHVAPLMGLYLVLIVIGASAPPVIALPIAQADGWRMAAGCWFLLSIAAMLPWFGLLSFRSSSAPSNHNAPVLSAWRWPTSWAIATVFAVGMLNMYSFVAWLPPALTDTAHVTPGVAALMLALFNFIGMPPALLAPTILGRRGGPTILVLATALCLCIGTLGIALLPGAAWLWVVLAGLGISFVPIGLSLLTVRSRSHEGATALSGMVQSAGYLIAAAGPFIVGSLHQVSGGWRMSFFFLTATGVVGLVAALAAIKPGTIEDAQAGGSSFNGS